MNFETKKKQSVIVIGAGPAGLTAALCLARTSNYLVTVLESDSQVGGLAKTIDLWQQKVDLGPHRFFSLDPRVNLFFDEVLANRYDMVPRLTRILYRKKFFFYPLKALNVFRNLGVFEAIQCILSFVKVQILPEKDDSHFEGWVTNRFGKRLYSIFFKSYSEKLWGISCRDLDAEFAIQRIKKLSLWSAIKNAVQIKKSTEHRSLIDKFKYPQGGSGALYEKMAQLFAEAGGKISLSTPVTEVAINDGVVQGVRLNDGRFLRADFVISTMPITTLIRSISNASLELIRTAGELKFRNTILVYLQIQDKNLFPDQWVYVHSPDLQTGRITNFRNWSVTLNKHQNETILVLEFWCNSEDSFWHLEADKLIELAIDDLHKSGLGKESKVTNGHVIKIPKSYPIYSTGYRSKIASIKSHLSKFGGLSVIGRAGAFKYNNQDHSILMGLLAAKNILGETHDLWEINSDAEYQEQNTPERR